MEEERAFGGREISQGGGAPRGAQCWLYFLNGVRIASFCPPCDLRDGPVGLTGSGRLTGAQLWPLGSASCTVPLPAHVSSFVGIRQSSICSPRGLHVTCLVGLGTIGLEAQQPPREFGKAAWLTF